MYKGLLYTSSINREFTLESVKKITDSFSITNKKYDVSGVLFFSKHCIMQYIEGTKEDVDNLYLNITKDIRHYNIIKLIEKDIDTKLFDEWGMKFNNIDFKKVLKFQQNTKEGVDVFKMLEVFAKNN